MENKKNTGFIVVIVILIIVIMGSGTYIAYDKFLKPKDNPIEEKEKTSTTDKMEEKITKKDATKAIVYDEGDNQYKKMPIINIDSVDADRLNKKISDVADIREEYNENFRLKYEFYENNDILSVIVISTTPASSIYYHTYNINIKTGKEVTNKEIIKLKKLDESEFKAKLFNVYEKDLEKRNILEVEKTQNYYGGDKSVYEGNKDIIFNGNIDDFGMYLNNENELCVAFCFYLVAGPEANYYIYNLDNGTQISFR